MNPPWARFQASELAQTTPSERVWIDGPIALSELVDRLAGWGLKALCLRETGLIGDLSPLAALDGLVELDLAGAALFDLGVVRGLLEQRCNDDMAARMVLGSTWAERYDFVWEEGYGDFWVEDRAAPDSEIIETIGVEDYIASASGDADLWLRLREAADLYDLDLRTVHEPLRGLSELPESLERLDLSRTAFFEISALVRLANLKRLVLHDSGVHPVDLEVFQARRPDVDVES